jgi:hypothetical protein
LCYTETLFFYSCVSCPTSSLLASNEKNRSLAHSFDLFLLILSCRRLDLLCLKSYFTLVSKEEKSCAWFTFDFDFVCYDFLWFSLQLSILFSLLVFVCSYYFLVFYYASFNNSVVVVLVHLRVLSCIFLCALVCFQFFIFALFGCRIIIYYYHASIFLVCKSRVSFVPSCF